MNVTAYVLIQTEVGKAVSVAEHARKITGVLSADDVTGPYDVIVKTEAPSLDELGKMVVSQIQAALTRRAGGRRASPAARGGRGPAR